MFAVCQGHTAKAQNAHGEIFAVGRPRRSPDGEQADSQMSSNKKVVN
jgi:hypothetical protein